MTISTGTPFRKIGGCSFSVWQNVAKTIGSPISDGDLRLMHDVADEHSALCLSQLVKESSFGKDASAQRTRNPLGLMTSSGDALVSFSSWDNAVREWRRRITDLAYKDGVYAPENMPLGQYLVIYVGGPKCWTSDGATCANGETWDGGLGGSVGLYITQTVGRINSYIGDATMTTNPYKKPTIYSLDRDYGRYRLTGTQAAKILSHRFTNRQGMRPLALVLHTQEGNTSSSLSWWASGNADASSSVMVNTDGSLLIVIPPEHGPWTNGDVKSPTPKGSALVSRLNGANVNLVTLSIETEGNSTTKVPDVVVETICWQLTEWMTTYGLTRTDIYKHADFNSVSRSFCPGTYWDQVMTRLGSTGTPVQETWPGKPSWLPNSMVRVLFPEADPAGSRTQAWFRICSSSGRAPRRVAFHGTGQDQLIEFSDGSLVDMRGKVLGES